MKSYTNIIILIFFALSLIELNGMDFNRSSDVTLAKYEELMCKSRSHFDNNVDSAIIYANMASKYMQDNVERGFVLESKGIAYLLKENHKTGFKKLGEAYVCFRNENDKSGLISLYMDLGKYYLINTQTKNSLKYYLKAKEISIKSGNVQELPFIYKSLGDIYCLLNQYDEAINCYNTLLSHNKIKDKEVQVLCLYNIGRIYFELDNFPKADSMFQLCKKYNLPKSARNYLSDIYLLQGNIELNKERYLQAEILYKKSLAFPQSINDSFITMSSIIGANIINGTKTNEDIELKKYHKVMNQKIHIGDHYKFLAMAYYIKKQNKLGDLYYNKAKQIYTDYNCPTRTLALISLKERYSSKMPEIISLLKEQIKIKETINKHQTDMLHVQNEFDALFITYIDRIHNNLQKEKERAKQMLIISIGTALTLIILFVFFIILRKKNVILKSQYKQLVESNELVKNGIITALRRIYHGVITMESNISTSIKSENNSMRSNFEQLFDKITNLLNLLSEQKNKH